MNTWWSSSPYWNVGIYLGGSAKACPNDPNLTAQWVSDMALTGWTFYPIWAGPQAPCNGGAISLNTTTADQQGRSEATAARNAAVALGFTGATVIFYDIEGYGAGGNQACDNAVHAFLNAWDVMLRETYGIHPGIYGSASGSGVQSWASLGNVPDDVYIAYTGLSNDAPMEVWNIPSVDNNSWKIQPPYGRHHQHTENVFETWGGVTFYIDQVCSRGHTAAAVQYGNDNFIPCPGTVPP